MAYSLLEIPEKNELILIYSISWKKKIKNKMKFKLIFQKFLQFCYDFKIGIFCHLKRFYITLYLLNIFSSNFKFQIIIEFRITYINYIINIWVFHPIYREINPAVWIIEARLLNYSL